MGNNEEVSCLPLDSNLKNTDEATTYPSGNY